MPTRRHLITTLFAASFHVAHASAPAAAEVWVEPKPGTDLDDLSQELQALGARILARVRQPVPAVAIRVDSVRLEQIRQMPGVVRVRPARVLHPPSTDPGTGTR